MLLLKKSWRNCQVRLRTLRRNLQFVSLDEKFRSSFFSVEQQPNQQAVLDFFHSLDDGYVTTTAMPSKVQVWVP